MSKTDKKSIRITITLNPEIYKQIKKISSQVGLRPATWVSMMITSKMNHVDVGITQGRGDS